MSITKRRLRNQRGPYRPPEPLPDIFPVSEPMSYAEFRMVEDNLRDLQIGSNLHKRYVAYWGKMDAERRFRIHISYCPICGDYSVKRKPNSQPEVYRCLRMLCRREFTPEEIYAEWVRRGVGPLPFPPGPLTLKYEDEVQSQISQ